MAARRGRGRRRHRVRGRPRTGRTRRGGHRPADAREQLRDARQRARGSSPTVSTRSVRTAPSSHRARWCARSAVRPGARPSPRSRWARRCARRSTRSAVASRTVGEIVAVLSGVANAFIPASALDTPLTYEAMRDAGSGLGAAGFIVIDDRTDVVAVAHGRRTLPVRRVVRAVHAVQAGRPRDGRPARQDPPLRRVALRRRRACRPRQDRRRQRPVHAGEPAADRREQLARAVPRRGPRPRRQAPARGGSVPHRPDPRDRGRSRSSSTSTTPAGSPTGPTTRPTRANGRRSASTNGARNPTRTDRAKR